MRTGAAGGSGSVVESWVAEGQGTAGKAVYGTHCQGKFRSGRYGRFRTVAVGRGMVWQSGIGLLLIGIASQRLERQAWRAKEIPGQSWYETVSPGEAGLSRRGVVCPGEAWMGDV